MSKAKNTTKTATTKAARELCYCQGSVHALVNNCLCCGKIVCEREGEGPCLFCGNVVFRRQKSGPNVASSEDPEFQRAEELKIRLLQYDASQIAETNIIDEATDWFEINENVWSSRQAKELASKKIEEESTQKDEFNKGTFIAFDGGQFIEEKKTFDSEKSKREVQQFYLSSQQKDREGQEKQIKELKGDQKLCNETLEVFDGVKKEFNEKYKAHIANKEKNKSETHQLEMERKIEALRREFNQDDHYDQFLSVIEELTPEDSKEAYDEQLYPTSADKGKCLSMLQPWASLLIEGFKRFEGRFWRTDYRGPLWIHAGATAPDPETLKKVEAEYTEFYKKAEKRPNFPERYPLGSLLGMVDLQTVLEGPTYQRVVPEKFREQSSAENVFVVRNPRKLTYPIKMSGNKDIYDLHPEIRKVAVKCLKRVRTDWWEYFAKNLSQMVIMEAVNNDKNNEKKTEMIVGQENKEAQKSSEVKEEKKQDNKSNNDNIAQPKKIWKNRSFQAKKEKIGTTVHDFFDEETLDELLAFLEDKAWEMKSLGNKNVAILDFNLAFPYYEQLNELFQAQKLSTKITNCGHFYINKKQKAFEFEDKYRVILNVGASVTLTVVDEEKDATWELEVPGGCFYFLGEGSKVSLQSQGAASKAGKKKGILKGDCTNLFVMF